MITRVLIFIALLVGGFVALYSLVDLPPPEAATEPDKSTGANQNPTRDNQGPGIPIATKGNQNSPVYFQPGGECEFSRRRLIHLPSGIDVEVRIQRIHARDSRSEAGNRLRLDDVTIDTYRIDESNPAGEPIKTSTVTATRAVVELTRDENQVLVAEDKLMEFWNLVFREGSDAAPGGTKITIGHALAINTPDMIHLWTPDRNEPVRLETTGKNGIVVHGKGLDAWVPSSRNQQGEVQLKAVGIKVIEIFSDPVLVRGNTTLRSKGRLKLREDTRTGAILISMEDTVEIRSIQSGRGGKDPDRTFVAKGDFLDASLSRVEVNGRAETQWRRLDLRGAPTHLTDQSGLDLKCRSLTVLPDTSGGPFWITAEGTDQFAPVMKHVADGHTSTYRCTGRVHVVQVGRQHDFFLRSFGLAGGIPTEFDQLILFEGQASLDSPKDGLHVSSSRGLTLIRSAIPDLRDYIILRGRGDVLVTSPQVHATGNRGFVLHQRPVTVGGKVHIIRDFRLGPAQADPRHRYDMRRLANRNAKPGSRDRQSFHLVGSGSCRIRLRGEAVEEVHLSSLAEDINIEMTGTEGHLWRVRTMDVWFLSDGTPGSFVAKGKDCHLKMTTAHDVVTGRAEEIHHPAANIYRLVGNLAEADSKQYGRLRGRDIVIQQLTDQDVRLRASQRAELHIASVPGRQPRTPRRNVDLDLRADEIRLEPFLVLPMAREVYARLLPIHGQTASARYLFAKGHVEFDYKIRDGNTVSSGTGRGDELRLRSDRMGELFTDGRLFGKPATIVSTDARGRKTSADSHIIAFLHDADGEFITLHPVPDHRPVLRLLSMPAGGREEPTRLMMTCDGLIQMTPDRIRCLFPVSVRSLDALGAVDPNGYRLDARSMILNRTEKGEIANVRADGDVEFHWADATGKCDRLSIDLLSTLITATGITRMATVEIPTGKFAVNELRYNYRTKNCKVWKARGTGRVFTTR